jgi:hypothetical protein
MVIGQHGSWNQSKLSGYKVVFGQPGRLLDAGLPAPLMIVA